MPFEIRPELKELYEAIDSADQEAPCTNFPEAYFADGYEAASVQPYARKLCEGCPVMQQCASYGIRFERWGIWGGLTENQRNKLRKRLGIVLPPEVS